MAPKLTRFARFVLISIPVSAVSAAAWLFVTYGPAGTASLVPTTVAQTGFKETAGADPTNDAVLELPSSDLADLQGPQVRMAAIAWNAQMGLLLANGGVDTTKGSLMEKKGVSLNITRAADDSYGPMQTGLVACATELAAGASECSSGLHFANIMGDGGPAFITGLNELLSKLDNGKGAYTAEIIGGTGRSDGEDAFMGPPACQEAFKGDDGKMHPGAEKCKGLRISGVIMDGDWNIAMSWAAQNGLCNNPDEKTYDPDCLNWYGTSSFVDADDAFINNTCEDLPVVSKGRKTGKTQNVCIGGVVTWTPGDVTVTQKKGGVVKLLSTKQNSGQMPVAIVGIKAWNSAHPKIVQGILSAALTGGNMIKTNPKALMAAAAISATVWGEGDAAYWAKYYKGTEELDATGQFMVPLGGSRAWNMADASLFFGITPGSRNGFEATYDGFGREDVKQYPDRMPTFIPSSKVLNLTYLRAVLSEAGTAPEVVGKADVPDFSIAPTSDVTVAQRAWAITFVTGSDKISPESEKTLAELEDVLVVAASTRVEIHGHTDNVGDPDANFDLSKRRSAAVQAWLVKNAPASFPAERVATFGHGAEQPVASNASPAGQSKNRRVEIVLKAM